jgi:hypothetical protein
MIGKKLARLVARYPGEPGVRPQSFETMAERHDCGPSSVLAFQSIPDKFYFLLFGALRARLADKLHLRAEVIVVRGISGAMGSGLIAALKRAAPLTWLLSRQWERAYGPLVDAVAYRCATWSHPIDDLLDWFRAGARWQQLRQQKEGFSLQVGGIEVADLVVDSYLRFRPSPEFNASDPFVRRLVWQALRDVRQANAYFRRVRPKLYLTSYTTYLEHGIPTRAAVHNGTEVWAFGSLNCFGKKLTQADTSAPPDFSGYRGVFESLDNKEARIEAARQQLGKRLAGGIDAATSYMRQSAYGRADVELPVDVGGAVVIFLHDFYDSPHVYPDLIFDDFWQWVCFTIENLQQSGVNFFLKQHPNQIALSDEALGRLRAKYPGLQWLPVGVSNVQLARAGIACGITAYGTVAHELAYLGVPSICSARHPHHSFDFCRTARTRDEYAGMLKTHDRLPMPVTQMQHQALAFYYMHNLYGSDDERALRHAFVEFWKACNVGPTTEDAVLHGLRGLVNLPAFDRFVATLAHSIVVAKVA